MDRLLGGKKQASNRYRWHGTLEDGKRVTGEIGSDNEAELIQRLERQKITIRKIKRLSSSVGGKRRSQAKPGEITQITSQLATMLTAGIPLLSALNLIAENQEKEQIKQILSDTGNQLREGKSLSESLSLSSPLFDRTYLSLVSSGEKTGRLPEVIDRIGKYRAKQEQLRSKTLKAMIYPCAVLLAVVAVTILMLAFVIPRFESMYASFDTQLPWLTRQVLSLSHAIRENIIAIVLLPPAPYLVARWLVSLSPGVRYQRDRLLLRLPIIGVLQSKSATSKFCLALSTNLQSGLPILSSLTDAAAVTDNLYFQSMISRAHKETSSGIPIHIAIKNTGHFPPLVTQMIMIGEQSGTLDTMLDKVATIYERELEESIDNLGKLIEPLIMATLGTLVGGLVLSMYLPIFNLMSVLG